MSKLNLSPGESIILNDTGVKHMISKGYNSGELVLTNKNLIFVIKGFFGGIKEIIEFPLDKIKLSEDEPQISMEKDGDGSYQLEIFFVDKYERFKFDTAGRKEVLKWLNTICKLLTGHESSTTFNTFSAIPGADQLAQTVKGTIDIFKNTLGISSPEKAEKPREERVAKKCIGCSAPLAGIKGQMVHCKYCDTDQVL